MKTLKRPIIRGFGGWRDQTAPGGCCPWRTKSGGGPFWLSICLFGTTRWLTRGFAWLETTPQAMAVLDAQFAWLRGAEKPNPKVTQTKLARHAVGVTRGRKCVTQRGFGS